MKEKLLNILNVKLDDVKGDINSLVELNGKIDEQNELLNYVVKMLSKFKENDSYNILHFAKLSKDDFSKVLDIVSNDAEKIFSTPSCNYDGLIYLINGINNGVSLSLTEEQKSGIEYLIRGLNKKQKEIKGKIDELNVDKSRFEINDLDELNSEKDSYDVIISELNNKNYISDIDKVCEAISFTESTNDETIDLLKFLLEYNAEVHKEGNFNPSNGFTSNSEEKKEEFHIENEDIHITESKENASDEDDDKFSFANIKFAPEKQDEAEPEEPSTGSVNEISLSKYLSDHEEDLKKDEDETGLDDLNKEEKNEEDKQEDASFPDGKDSVITPEEYQPFEIPFGKEEKEPEEEKNENDSIEINVDEFPPFGTDSLEKKEDSFGAYFASKNQENEEKDEDELNNAGEVEIEPRQEELPKNDSLTIEDVKKVFDENNIKLEPSEKLLSGNIDNYREIIELLKNNNILVKISKNEELFTEMLLSSTKDDISEILRIIKEDLSVDDEDYKMTLDIVINTLPSIFINDGGNYSNFVKNVQMFKEYGLNLIKLFDFSKEIFIVTNSIMEDNYAIVKKYNVTLDYQNAKYLLVLSDIAERMDYYVESRYVDKTKNDEAFDGINYINQYSVKLSIVKPETIKRLRYASNNGKKVFGSKPNSLTGEITNLKVKAMDMPNDYLDSFFDNNFDGLTSDEVREYTKLVRNSSNVGNYADELGILDSFREEDLRYRIDDILVSYNKVVRNYNILRSYGINASKALHFAVCYNLVITKDEYKKIKETLDKVGGND